MEFNLYLVGSRISSGLGVRVSPVGLRNSAEPQVAGRVDGNDGKFGIRDEHPLWRPLYRSKVLDKRFGVPEEGVRRAVPGTRCADDVTPFVDAAGKVSESGCDP